MSIYLACNMAAFILGLVSRHYRRAFAMFLLLSLPALWLFAHEAPNHMNFARANHDGFLNFYVKIFEKLTPETKTAIFLLPVLFVAGRIFYVIYSVYFYKKRPETLANKKKRIVKMFGEN